MDSEHSTRDGLRQGLRDLGYVEGRDYVLEERYAESQPDRLSDVIAELLQLKVASHGFRTVILSVILAISWPTLLVHVSAAQAVCYDNLIIGQDFRGSIYSAAAEQSDSPKVGKQTTEKPEISTVCAIFDELRTCWVPQLTSLAKSGMQMTVRFAFKRDGEILATPRVTYVTAGARSEVRDTYFEMITKALDRCTPMRFTEDLASVVVGHPFAIRFVDDRTGLPQ
jgi:hypothetical protein